MRYTLLLVTVLLVACQSAQKPADQLPPEVSLKADRSQLDEARKDIPEETKRENDELAFIRQLMAQGDTEPGKIREKWSQKVRDRREKFDRTLRKQREDFNKKERGNREAFLKKLKTQRESFMKSAKKGESKEFFAEQDAQRNDYFNDERDNRKDFESQVTETRKSFEAYVTERTNQFNAEMRDYTTNFHERKKQLDVKKRVMDKTKPAGAKPTGDSELEEFKQIQKVPATPLAPPAER